MQAARRIGLMGGSFDPVHQAHVALAELALRELQLDEVRWIPAGQPWQKARQLAPAADRVAMVRLAIRHEPRFVVDTVEVERSGPSYTLDTVRSLQAGLPGQANSWFLIIGQDQYANFHTWHGWEELLDRVTLAVAGRAGQVPQAHALLSRHPHQLVLLPLPSMAVSSTDIRARLARGDDAASLVPAMVSEAVARYIADHQLYAPEPPLNGHP